MGVTKNWTGNNDMAFYYGDGSPQTSAANGNTALVGAYGDYNGTRYGQVLWFKTDANGGVGFTFTWKAVSNTGSNLSLRCGISTVRQDGCDNSGVVSYYSMSSIGSNNLTCSNNSYVFLPNTTYYIYVNRASTDRGYYYYASENSGWGSASITVNGASAYNLTTSVGTGSSITVNRTSSPSAGAATGNLSSGATIYYNDILNITFGTSTGYNLGAHTVNGSTFTSGNNHTVSGTVSVVSTATVKTYKLSLNPGEGSEITVNRTSSPLQGASTGNISNGATIYYNDVLKVTTSADIIHEILTQMLNGSSFVSGASHTVTNNVSIETTTRILGIAHISDGTKLETYLIYIYDENGWSQYIPYIDNGTSWDICN